MLRDWNFESSIDRFSRWKRGGDSPAVQTAGTSGVSFALQQERRINIACPASLPGREPFSENASGGYASLHHRLPSAVPSALKDAVKQIIEISFAYHQLQIGTERRCQIDRRNIFRVPSVTNTTRPSPTPHVPSHNPITAKPETALARRLPPAFQRAQAE